MYKEAVLNKLKENIENKDYSELKSTVNQMNEIFGAGCTREDLLSEIDDIYRRDPNLTNLSNSERFLLTKTVKDPKKQNIYEKTFVNHLNVNGFRAENLPNNGKETYYINSYSGDIITNVSKKESARNGFKELHTKSIDCIAYLEEKTYYIFHKYTNEPGGAQDNVKGEIIQTIKESVNFNELNSLVCFVCDGEYFTPIRQDAIRESINNENIKVFFSTSEFVDFLNNEQ